MASNVQSKSLLEAAQRYAQEITPEVLIALDERGISEAVAARYQLGAVVDPANGHEMHEGWISIPYITARIVQHQVRQKQLCGLHLCK